MPSRVSKPLILKTYMIKDLNLKRLNITKWFYFLKITGYAVTTRNTHSLIRTQVLALSLCTNRLFILPRNVKLAGQQNHELKPLNLKDLF